MTSIEHSVTYYDADITLHGVMYRDEPLARRLPGILLIHGGAGLDEHARQQGRRWSALGYAVFVCDMYGEGVVGDRDRTIASITALRDDPSLLVRRARAGLDALRQHGHTTGRVGVVGYCFGGMAALTLARAGMDIAAAVSIHGSLATTQPARPDAVTAKILVCHGSADPHVPLDQITAFAREMDNARAHWQMIVYGGAMHGFTHQHANAAATPGVAYHEEADRLSFDAAGSFLAKAIQANT